MFFLKFPFFIFLITFFFADKKNSFSFLKKEFPQFNNFNNLKLYKAIILKKIPNQKPNYCQGIFYHENFLYYSSGLYGKSVLKKINLKDNRIEKKYLHNENVFAEGISLTRNFLWQLSWREKKVFVFSIQNLKFLKTFSYRGEGWGLTHDENYFIMSDGSEFLSYRSKKDFSLQKKKKVYFQNKSQKVFTKNINALQRVEGNIFANIWFKKVILIIDKKESKIIGAVNCQNLFLQEKKLQDESDVLNGIAHKEKNIFYLTGKNWQNIYLVEFVLNKSKIQKN